MSTAPRILLVSGGTGGHLYPGLAVAEAILAEYPDAVITVLGPEGRTDHDAIAPYRFRVLTLRVRGLASGARWYRRVQSALELAVGTPVRAARRLLRREQPEVVFATGGYVAGPVLVAAKRLGIPSVLFDMNCPVGLATRWAAGFASVVALGSSDCADDLTRPRWRLPGSTWPPQVEITGTPVRRAILETDRDAARRALGVPASALALVVTSGSLGARPVNEAVVGALSLLAADEALCARLWVLHLTGPRNAVALPADRARQLGLNYRAEPFRREMAQPLAAADLVVTRAGGSALAEITARGLPAIVIPWAGAPAGHQEGNARRLESREAAVVIRETELTPERLAEEIRALCQNAQRRAELAARARAAGAPDAATRVAALVLALRRADARRTMRTSSPS